VTRPHSHVSLGMRAGLLVACVAGVAFGTACGKKGPPLAPIVRLPAAVQGLTAARLGHEVYLTLTLPSANVDSSTPADLSYVDVYAYTGTDAPPRAGFLEQAMRIARVPVVSVVQPGDSGARPVDEVAAGATVTIADTVPDPTVAGARRFYLAVPFSLRNRPGPQHTPVPVPLTPLPPPPIGVEVNYTASAVTVSWKPAGGLPPSPGRVNVYRQSILAPGATVPVWKATRPVPLNAMPLTAPPFTEPVTFGVESCYELRSVEGDGPAAVEGDASTAVCVTPVDRFPPAAPVQLVAVATEGAINLLWEANTESDLSGYIVLRGAVGDARLQPLTPMPISDVRYADTTVVSGMRYVYAVVAVDRQSPTPNMSPESARVEETAQ
jgi:hypothetical protein